MAAGSAALAWAVGLGTLAVAGVGIVLYEKSQAAPASTAVTAVAPNGTSPCTMANNLAAAAASSSDPNAELGPYNIWAAQCRAAGGTPNPFPA